MEPAADARLPPAADPPRPLDTDKLLELEAAMRRPDAVMEPGALVQLLAYTGQAGGKAATGTASRARPPCLADASHAACHQRWSC